MKTRTSVCITLGLLLALSVTASAASQKKSRKKKDEQTTRPVVTPTPPPAPSVDIAHFLGEHLEKILAPLEQKIVLPRAELARLRESFAARFTRASLAERPQFQAALSVCDAITQAMNERGTAAVRAPAIWPQRSAQLRQYIQQLAEQERATEAQVPSTLAPKR